MGKPSAFLASQRWNKRFEGAGEALCSLPAVIKRWDIRAEGKARRPCAEQSIPGVPGRRGLGGRARTGALKSTRLPEDLFQLRRQFERVVPVGLHRQSAQDPESFKSFMEFTL